MTFSFCTSCVCPCTHPTGLMGITCALHTERDRDHSEPSFLLWERLPALPLERVRVREGTRGQYVGQESGPTLHAQYRSSKNTMMDRGGMEIKRTGKRGEREWKPRRTETWLGLGDTQLTPFVQSQTQLAQSTPKQNNPNTHTHTYIKPTQ